MSDKATVVLLDNDDMVVPTSIELTIVDGPREALDNEVDLSDADEEFLTLRYGQRMASLVLVRWNGQLELVRTAYDPELGIVGVRWKGEGDE